MQNLPLSEWLEPCRQIARQAGDIILKHYEGSRSARAKSDRSPVTDADVASNDHIVSALRLAFPSIPVISEEDASSLTTPAGELFWLVDPLDGTRSFVEGTGEFSVNIGLVKDREPVLGVLYVPVQNRLYYAAKGQGAFLEADGTPARRIHIRTAPAAGITVVRSQSHPSPATNTFLQKFTIASLMGSSSAAKFGMVAEGSADMYPRLGRTMEWDTAAGHIIVLEAGGCVLTIDGTPLTYGKPDYANPSFIAYGDASLIQKAA